MSSVIVTGGAGFIGSHTCVELLAEGYDVVVLDDLRNARTESLRRIERIAGRPVEFHRVDLCDEPALRRVIESCARRDLAGVIHFAGLKAVGDSVARPLEYFSVNLGSTLNLLQCLDRIGCRNLVFSSSSTVYDADHAPPFREDAPLKAANPYGQTKVSIEDILRSTAAADPRWRFLLLRYFNPAGAHASGLLGEDPAGVPGNLIPFIHLVDLARGHLADAVRFQRQNPLGYPAD